MRFKQPSRRVVAAGPASAFSAGTYGGETLISPTAANGGDYGDNTILRVALEHQCSRTIFYCGSDSRTEDLPECTLSYFGSDDPNDTPNSPCSRRRARVQ